jgi:hypothetical protein
MQEHEQRTEKISRSDAARVVGNDVRGMPVAFGSRRISL